LFLTNFSYQNNSWNKNNKFKTLPNKAPDIIDKISGPGIPNDWKLILKYYIFMIRDLSKNFLNM